MRNFMVLQWRVMVTSRTVVGRKYETYVLRWRDTRVEITETLDGDFEFSVNKRPLKGTNGKHLDSAEVDVLLSLWCAQDMAEAQQHFTLDQLHAAALADVDAHSVQAARLTG